MEKAPTVKKKQPERRNNLRRSYVSASRNGARSDLKKLKIVIAFSSRWFLLAFKDLLLYQKV